MRPNGAVPGARVAGVWLVLLAPLRGVGMTAQATEGQHQTDHMEVSFLSTPYALLGGLIFEKIDLFEAQEVKSAFESGFSG